jgi:hypothetical protein
MAAAELPRVLVAAPSYAGKEYAADRWIEAYEALTYEPRGALIVDNTRGSDGYSKMLVDKGIRAIHVNPLLTFDATFHRCWQLIHQEAVIEGFDWVFSVEADNIVPPESLSKLMEVAQVGQFEVVTHVYPMHLLDQARHGRTPWMNRHRFVYNELGCCLMSTRLLGLGLADTSRYVNFTAALFQSASKYLTGWATVCKLFDGEMEHLDGYEMEYSQFFVHSEDDGRWNPYQDVELPDYNTVIPPSVAEDYDKIGLKLQDGHYHVEAEGTVIKG